MKRFLMSLAVAGSAFAFWACAGTTTNSSSPKACNSDSDCAGEICNTVGHVCMKGCSAGADCTDTSRNCDFIKDAAGNNASSSKVCQCQTDQLCGGGTTYCHPVDKLCEVKCGADTDCQNFSPTRSCVASQCAAPGSGTDGGTTGGGNDAGPTCTQANQTTNCAGSTQYTYETCNGTSCGACTGDVGSGTNCEWGDKCNNGGAGFCGPIGLDTCSRASSAPAFNPSAQGPLITVISGTHSSTSDTSTECSDGLDKIEVQITFQAGPNGLTTHSTQLDFNSHHVRYINSQGNESDIAFSHNRPGAGDTSGTFTAGLCGLTTLNGGAFFLRDETGNAGNAACVNVN